MKLFQEMDSKTTHTSCNDGDDISPPSCSTLPSFKVTNSNSYKRHSLSPANSNLYDELPTSFKSKSSYNRHSYGHELTRENFVDLETKVNQCFDKRYYFKRPIEDWKLPPPNEMFISSKWQIHCMQQMKTSLNNTKNKLNDYNLDDWHKHTRSTNKAGEIQWKLRKEYEPEFVTQAWCKLYENLMTFLLVPSITIAKTNAFDSVHLCEAPGAFVTALNHYLKIHHPGVSWRWMATTLNPYYEGNPLSSMINDDRFILQTLPHWNFGVDFTGNLMNLKNMSHLVEEANTMGYVRLVTADGSIDCQEDPGEQELIVASLHYCEAVTALHMLAKGGNFLLKMFTFYECDSVCLMYLLCCSFKSVVVNKPVTSKEGNSEVYVVCMDYRGRSAMGPWLAVLRHHYGPERPSYPMFLKESIPDGFLTQLEECAHQFKSYQVDVIMNNIRAFHGRDRDKRFMLRKLRYMVAEHFMEKYQMRRLNEEDKVVGQSLLNEVSTLNMDPRSEDGSYNDKRRRATLNPVELLQTLGDDIEGLRISWPYGDNLIKWLTFPVQLQHFAMETGKPVGIVSSSKFCLGRLLKIRNQVKDIAITEFNYNPEEFVSPGPSHKSMLTTLVNSYDDEHNRSTSTDSDFIEEYEEENEKKDASVQLPLLEQLTLMYPGSMVLNFREDLWSSMERGSNQEAQKNAFEDIKEAIDELWRENTLILMGYPLLTQFNVGMVYMLSHMFEEVGFVKPHKQDFAIVFRSFRHWNVEMRKFLDDVEKRIEVAEGSNENVLALMPINLLCGNVDYKDKSTDDVRANDGPRHFYTCVTETNHLCVKEQTLDIISNLLQANQ